jgi:hypothetical protein
MHSVGLTLGWELWRRHRLWFVLTAVYLAAASAVVLALDFGALAAPAALVAVAPLGGVAALLLAFFTYSTDMDLLAPGSGFPGRLFTTPVSTAALAGWPMLYGASGVALLWLAVALLILRPSGLAVPLVWPALLAAAFTAWTQVFLWWPVGWPLARVFAIILLVIGFTAAPQVWVDYELPERAAAPALAALLAAAYPAAVAGVRRARRGEGQGWPSPWQWARRLWAGTRRPRAPFASPGSALVWLEWRRGRVLALLNVLLLPWLVLLLVLLEGPVVSPWARWGGFLLPPVLIAFTAGAGMGDLRAEGRKAGIPSFLGTLPVSSAAFVAAKLKAAALATLALWLPTYGVVHLLLLRPAHAAEAAQMWGHLLGVYPPWKAEVVVVLGAVALPALTWKGLVENLAFGLTGRPRVIGGSAFAGTFAGLALCVCGSMAREWVAHNPATYEPLRRLAWGAAATAVLIKLLLAGWAVRALHRRRLVPPRALAGWLAVWLVLTAGLFGLLAWLVPPGLASLPALALASVLLVPLARPALAPLALAWDRHR